jgi:hypothetical protein
MAVLDSARPSAATSAMRHSTPHATAAAVSRGRTTEHLQAAPAEDRSAKVPQPARFELQPDQEQHQHHAELGKVQDVLHVGHQAQPPGPDGHAGSQVADDGPQAQGFAQRHGNDGGAQVDEAVDQPGRVCVPCR